MGDCMARNLIKGGRDVIVWNRTRSKAVDFSRQTGCQTAGSPREVVEQCDITYSMLSTPEVVAKVFFDPEDGSLAGLSEGKSFIDCATLEVEDMQDMYRAANSKGAKFLESPVSGSKGPAAKGQLVFLCGGDKDLYDRVANDFSLMGKFSPFSHTVWRRNKINMIMATMLASVAEGICLSESLGLNNDTLIEILGQGATASPLIAVKGPLMNKRDYSLTFSLKHALKDMNFALGLGVKTAQALPLASATNAEYMRAKGRHANDDFCSVIEALRSRP
eukprot:jgi/Undpi1/8934/HiC_scaffold_26.g11395.m1